MKRSQMKRSMTPMNQVGPRTKRRNKATAYLRRTVPGWEFCELRREGCTVYVTDWAHAKKSRKLQGADWETAARSCRNCHTGPNGIEHLQPEEMERAVMEAIARRNT